MRYLHAHLATARKILENYQGEIPFSAFLKNYFSKEKKYGSKDRKSIAALCYNAFRTGLSVSAINENDRLMTGLFLFSEIPNEELQAYNPLWNENASWPLFEKIKLTAIDVENIFPYNAHLSDEIDKPAFNASFLQQPDLFIRIRPGYEIRTRKKLEGANIIFREINNNTLAFENGVRLDNILDINKEAVIQDLNSQGTSKLFELMELPATPKVWDCCAASGGKSIMAIDFVKKPSLTISDVRHSIIHNLRGRLTEAGIRNYKSFVADLTDAGKIKQQLEQEKFDMIICDAPCSGSGTWDRTPEQLLYFKENEIDRYSQLQKTISKNVLPYLNESGYLLYITCSVFKKENEEVVKSIEESTSLTLIKQELLKGYEHKADTMFAALFQLN